MESYQTNDFDLIIKIIDKLSVSDLKDTKEVIRIYQDIMISMNEYKMYGTDRPADK